jgi:ABC-type uncharacterized transport system permease subunit
VNERGLETRFPATPVAIRLFIILYPLIVLGLGWIFPDRSGLWIIAILCGFVWFGAVCVFFATTFRREGYQAALDDIAGGTTKE